MVVTGAGGLIGAAVVRSLESEGHAVVRYRLGRVLDPRGGALSRLLHLDHRFVHPELDVALAALLAED